MKSSTAFSLHWWMTSHVFIQKMHYSLTSCQFYFLVPLSSFLAHLLALSLYILATGGSHVHMCQWQEAIFMFTYINDRRQSSSHTSVTEGSEVNTHQWQEAVVFTYISDRRQPCSHTSVTGGSQVHTCQWQEAVKCPSAAKYCLAEWISWMRSAEIMNFDLIQLHNEIWWPWLLGVFGVFF